MRQSPRLATVALTVLVVASAGCGSGGGATGPPPAGTSDAGTVAVGLDGALAGFNMNTSAANVADLQEILDVVWPQPYITGPGLVPVRNSQLLSDVSVTGDPQTVTYTINPRARWQDGTPITADDFVYNWQAQSGNPAWTDVDHQPYDAVSTDGYDQISSVTGSDPAGGAACSPGSTADRNAGLCPNGSVVTVTFSSPYADWQSLFANLVPAHVARKVGWNTGFTGPASVVSGSWYKVQSYVPGRDVVLVRNPAYWGTTGHLDRITFRLYADSAEESSALEDGQVQAISPASVTTTLVHDVGALSATARVTVPGLQFEHLDFNQADPYLSRLQVRQAIAYGTDRAKMIADTVGKVAPSTRPLGNHLYVTTQPQYVDNGAAYTVANPAQARSLLQGLGYRKAADGYFQPPAGPQAGKDLTFTVQAVTGDPTVSTVEKDFQVDMRRIGIHIRIANQTAQDFYGTVLPTGAFQIAELSWTASPYGSTSRSIYCSYTDVADCGRNWIHYADPQVDQLLAAGSSASSPAQEASDLNAADRVLWQDMATLPLFQDPRYFAWSDRYGHMAANTSAAGLPWNANLWDAAAP